MLIVAVSVVGLLPPLLSSMSVVEVYVHCRKKERKKDDIIRRINYSNIQDQLNKIGLIIRTYLHICISQKTSLKALLIVVAVLHHHYLMLSY
jgi:hypothetical protein